ncbi:MAG: transcriptional antiterminator, Rof [Pseudomonadota bacterium]
MTDYIPIDCAIHSDYELAIMRRRQLRLTWRGEDSVIHIKTVTPTDLRTCNHEEFIDVTDVEGTTYSIRLDRIQKHEILQPGD